MAFHELFTSGWAGTEKYGPRVIRLSDWMIDVHRVLRRTKNTAYAYEGLISAWEAARLSKNNHAMKKIANVIDSGLHKLTSWQVGGPLESGNAFLKGRNNGDPNAVGGGMNSKNDPQLRVDVTQHQMHAVILARRFIYQKE